MVLNEEWVYVWRRVLFIPDNQESGIKETFENYSNNGSVSPVAWRPMQLTTMINYHLYLEGKYEDITFILFHIRLLHHCQIKVTQKRNLLLVIL